MLIVIGNKMLKTIAVSEMLLNVTHRSLAELYNQNMEVQVNVAQGNGTRIEGEYKGGNHFVYLGTLPPNQNIQIQMLILT
jgi:hypothetical protein